MAKKATLVTGTVGQDSHVIGIKILSRYLRENGYTVVELGGLTPTEEFIKAAQETAADAILIMRPPWPALIIAFAHARSVRNTPSRFTLSTLRQFANDFSLRNMMSGLPSSP